MRTFAFLVIPALAASFTPTPQTSTFTRGGSISVQKYIDEYADTGTSKVEALCEKADDLVSRKALDTLNHVPLLYTLYGFGQAAGSSQYGIDAAAAAFTNFPATAFAIPAYVGNLFPFLAAIQLASVAKSALASSNEIDQGSITASSVSYYAATKALTSGGLPWLIVTALVSSYPNRNGASFKAGIHNLSTQILSSVTTVVAILASITKVCSFIPFLDGKDEVVALLGLFGFYANSKRAGNSTVKKSVNAAVILGLLWSKISGGGLSITNLAGLLSMKTVTLAATAVIAWVTSKTAKEAI